MAKLQTGILRFLALSKWCELAMGRQLEPCEPFSPTLIEFSSSFQEPTPPSVNNEFTAHWIQHKWNANLSHISAGFLYNSPTAMKVRADEAYNMSIASSIFDYTNISTDGLVSNILYTFSPSITSPPGIFSDYVNPGFPLFTEDILETSGAVFTGLTTSGKNGQVASWSLMYQGAIPVTVFLTNCNTIVGYEFFAPDLRTRVVTEFFNIVVGSVPDEVFQLLS